MSQEFRLKNIDETKIYFLEEIKQNGLMSRSHKKVCTALNYIELFLTLSITIIRCISISAFTHLIGISIGITSSAIGLKICTKAAGIKKYNSTIKKKKQKNDKMILLSESKLNSIEASISKAIIDSFISHDSFVLTNTMQTEYDEMKEEIRHLKT